MTIGFIPHLADILLEQSHPLYKVFLWPDGAYGCTKKIFRAGRVRERSLEDGMSIVKTNNYALLGSLVLQEPSLLDKFRTHGYAMHNIHSVESILQRMPMPLSLVNVHPCSQTVLRVSFPSRDCSEGVTILEALIKRYIHDDPEPIQITFGWAKEGISQAKDIFREALGQ